MGDSDLLNAAWYAAAVGLNVNISGQNGPPRVRGLHGSRLARLSVGSVSASKSLRGSLGDLSQGQLAWGRAAVSWVGVMRVS